MCGIIAIVALGEYRIEKSHLKTMTDVIAHRGPDGEGHWINDDQSVGFGHRRLSIIDLSSRGSQPMEYKSLVITYNGEIYNYPELRSELIEVGYTFKSESDTEVILASYDFWGADCVSRLNGMWSFVIYDKEKNEVFCSRDRYGIKPFYYYQTDNLLYFASEIKQLTLIPGWVSTLNKTKAFDFLQNSLINHTAETLFESVFELRGGHNLIAIPGSKDFRIVQYYNPADTLQQGTSSTSQADQILDFKRLMTDAIKLTLRSDVNVGSALSGGIDSSIIASVSFEILKPAGKSDNQQCVSACFTGDKIDESLYIDALSENADIKVHKVYPSFNDFLDNLDKIVWHQDEPFSTLSIYAQYTVFREAAAKGIPVMLDGQGADEILAGYSSFYKPYLKSLLKNNPLSAFELIIDYFRIHKEYNLKLIFKHILSQGHKDEVFTESFKNYAKKSFRRPSESTLKDCSVNHLIGYGLHSLLRYEDRNSMAFSIESRVPFLDHRIVTYSLRLNDDLKIKNGIRKYILREAFKEKLPDVIYKRYDKLGFPTPQERWTSANMDIFVNLLSEAQKILDNKIIRKEFIEDIKKRVASMKEESDIYMGWRIIIFSRWVKVFNVVLD